MDLVNNIQKIRFPPRFINIFSLIIFLVHDFSLLGYRCMIWHQIWPSEIVGAKSIRLCQQFLSDNVWLQRCKHSPLLVYFEGKYSWCSGKERSLSNYSTSTHLNNSLFWALSIFLTVLILYLKHTISYLLLNSLRHMLWMVVYIETFLHFLFLMNSSNYVIS